MRALLAAVLAIALVGCAGVESTATTSVAVGKAACDGTKVKNCPSVYPADSLSGTEDIFTEGTALWADRLARKACMLELTAFFVSCSESGPAPAASGAVPVAPSGPPPR